jgi:hypothetical protein
MIGTGKEINMVKMLNTTVLTIVVPAILVLKKSVKCCRRGFTQGLPRIPRRTLKSLKAMISPYMGTYTKMITQNRAGNIST